MVAPSGRMTGGRWVHWTALQLDATTARSTVQQTVLATELQTGVRSGLLMGTLWVGQSVSW
jgi:phosphatidylethanolamine-binding protein (PEBP) family uncharacterized protein